MNSSRSGQGQVAGCHEHGNEPYGSSQYRKFLNYLSNFSCKNCFTELVIELNGLPEHSGNKINTVMGMKQLLACYLH